MHGAFTGCISVISMRSDGDTVSLSEALALSVCVSVTTRCRHGKRCVLFPCGNNFRTGTVIVRINCWRAWSWTAGGVSKRGVRESCSRTLRVVCWRVRALAAHGASAAVFGAVLAILAVLARFADTVWVAACDHRFCIALCKTGVQRCATQSDQHGENGNR